MKVETKFSYSGNARATLYQLVNGTTANPTHKHGTLSNINYPAGSVENQSEPCEKNQAVFMDMPMSWWVEKLLSKQIYYDAVSNYVNWSYDVTPEHTIHISKKVTDLLIPSVVEKRTYSKETDTHTHVYKPKFGLSRTDFINMSAY